MTEYIDLEIIGNKTILISQAEKVLLPIGTEIINGYIFKHSPITPYEAEIAIEHIENLIIPARYKFPSQNLYVSCSDNRLKVLAKNNNNFITTEQIETSFNEIVNVINGSPANTTTLPVDKSFTLFLLIIREISHHWGLSEIIINNNH